MMDLHCHLDLYDDPIMVAHEAERRGVYVLAVGTTPKSFLWARDALQGFSRIRPGLGFHPEIVVERQGEWDLFLSLLPTTKYVGEVGLDFSANLKSSVNLQQRVFNDILEACSEHGGKIISIHSRKAVSTVLQSLRTHPGAGCCILHWFTGTTHELQQAVELGCYFSVGPAMLSNQKGKQLVSLMPRNRILTETDGPLGRVRNRPLHPWDAQQAVELISSIWDCSVDSAEQTFRANLIDALNAQ